LVDDIEYSANTNSSRINGVSYLEKDNNPEVDSLNMVNDCLTSPLLESEITPAGDSFGHHTRIVLGRDGQI